MNRLLKPLWYIPLLSGVGFSIGLVLGMGRDFGFRHMIANIQLNSHTFTDQYVPDIFIALVLLIVGSTILVLKPWLAKLLRPNQRLQLTGDAHESKIYSAGADEDVPPRAAGN